MLPSVGFRYLQILKLKVYIFLMLSLCIPLHGTIWTKGANIFSCKVLFACSEGVKPPMYFFLCKICEINPLTCVFVSTGGIVNVMPLLFSQISHNKTQVSLLLWSILHHLLIRRTCVVMFLHGFTEKDCNISQPSFNSSQAAQDRQAGPVEQFSDRTVVVLGGSCC